MKNMASTQRASMREIAMSNWRGSMSTSTRHMVKQNTSTSFSNSFSLSLAELQP